MQSDRRHELEENDLAETTVALLERLRPHLTTAAVAAAVALAGIAAWTLVKSQRAAADAASWDAAVAAFTERNPARLDEVVRKYPGSAAARWSQLILAESAVEEGSQLLFADRAKARERLENAAAIYAAVLAERPSAMIAERATFGLAKARENLGQIEEALQGYRAVVAEHPAGALREVAEQRAQALARPSTREWYAWFAEQKPAAPPAAGPAGASGAPPQAAAPTDAPVPPSAADSAGAAPAGAAAGAGTDAAR
jgi:predicted negative regulator of RcsB-dependent stress response